jgi:hypothetical protein
MESPYRLDWRRNSLREIVSVKYGWLHMRDSIAFSHFFRFRSEWNQLQAHTDRTRFGNATFQFSMTFNFNIFQCFSNIRDHLSNFSYLVCISCKIFTRWRFYLFLKTENSRRVAESRPVCVSLRGRLSGFGGGDRSVWAFLLTGEANFFLAKPNLSILRMHLINFARKFSRFGEASVESSLKINGHMQSFCAWVYLI